MFSKRLAAVARAASRTVPSLGLAAAVLATTLGAPISALADEPIVRDHRGDGSPVVHQPPAPDPSAPPPIVRDHRADRMGGDPVARVQVTLKSVYIINDRDWGDGEFEFWYTLVCADEVSNTCLGYNEVFLDGYGKQFGAGSGETYTLNQTLPVDGSASPGYPATAATGYPIYPGRNYRLRFGMNEKDQFTNWENMGDFRHHMTADNSWGVGTYKLRSVHNDGSPGDFELTFEVRNLEVPDLRPVNIKVTDLPGSTKKHVCTAVQNIEQGAVGYFEVALLLDGAALAGGVAAAPGLTPGNYTEVCADPELPTSGQHQLKAVADLGNAVLEFNEANNTYETTYTGTEPAPGPAPSPGPILLTNDGKGKSEGQSQADLTVSAIKVNGQAPDGKNDCKDGKNAVVVAVKNAGAEEAKGFSVRLVVDDAQGAAIEQSVVSLAAGQEREVRFEEVRLKKGEHQIAASVAGKNKSGDAKADNNELTVTARCQGTD
jgi:hypothetical protein